MQNQTVPFPAPAIDDRSIYDVVATKFAFPALAMSVEIGLFEHLSQQARTISEIAGRLQLSQRAAEALTSVASAMGFLKYHQAGRFGLTDVARTYLLSDSPFFRRDFVGINTPAVDQLRCALQSGDEPVQPFAVKIAELPEKELQDFMRAMHAMTLPAASVLSEQPVFHRIDTLLDVAGGSGSLCIAIASRHSKIRCTIMDIEPVCRIAEENVRSYSLAERITVSPGDMFHDPWPVGFDGLLFGNIFHDWDSESCRFLARRAFDVLEPGGIISLHEMLLDEHKDGPLTVACYSIAMLLHEKGKQFTANELKEILTDAGFRDYQVTPTFGYYSLVTAKKV